MKLPIGIHQSRLTPVIKEERLEGESSGRHRQFYIFLRLI